MSKQKPKLSEALQTSLSSIQEAWKDWENIPQSTDVQSNKDEKQEQLQKDAGHLFEKLKDQLNRLSE